MEIRKCIAEEIEKLEKVRDMIKKHETKPENISLRCTKNHGSFQYYLNGKYTSKTKIDKVRAIAQRDYEKKLLPKLDDHISKLYAVQSIYGDENLETVYSSFCEGKRILIKPYFPDKMEYIQKWLQVEYDHWEIEDDEGVTSKKGALADKDKSYNVKGKLYTLKGERVRSKSEKIIADEFTRFRIPYRYEYPLQLLAGNHAVTVRPDFMVLNPRTLQEFIVEHMGMMDKSEYNNTAIDKIDLYEKNGYLIGKNLIILHETYSAPLNMSVLDKYIQEYLL